MEVEGNQKIGKTTMVADARFCRLENNDPFVIEMYVPETQILAFKMVLSPDEAVGLWASLNQYVKGDKNESRSLES